MNFSLAIFALFAFAALTAAYPTYPVRLPNGDAFLRPDSGIDCLYLGHDDCVPGAPRNQFGKDFADNGREWNKKLCQLDSDGDGLTNGQELGDPCCKWTPTNGFKLRQMKLSHPGDPSSKNTAPKKCGGGSGGGAGNGGGAGSGGGGGSGGAGALPSPKPLKSMKPKPSMKPNMPGKKMCKSASLRPWKMLKCMPLGPRGERGWQNLKFGAFNAQLKVDLKDTKFVYSLKTNKMNMNITKYAVQFGLTKMFKWKMLEPGMMITNKISPLSVWNMPIPGNASNCCKKPVYANVRISFVNKFSPGTQTKQATAVVGLVPCNKNQCSAGDKKQL